MIRHSSETNLVDEGIDALREYRLDEQEDEQNTDLHSRERCHREGSSAIVSIFGLQQRRIFHGTVVF